MIAPIGPAIVTSDDVAHGKPNPEGYVKALALLGAGPAGAIVSEDTEAGIASARAAGRGRVQAVRTTLDPDRLLGADQLFGRIDVEARAEPEIIVVAVGHALPPRTGVRSNEHEPELGARGAILALLGDVGMRAGEP